MIFILVQIKKNLSFFDLKKSWRKLDYKQKDLISQAYNNMQDTSGKTSYNNSIAKMLQIYDSIQSEQILLGNIQDVEVGDQSTKFSQVFREKTETRVKNTLEACSVIQQFLELQIYHIIDILQRKSTLIDYFTILKEQLRLVEKSSLQAFKQITFVDFTILLMKLTQPNDIISVLLARQMAPMPITYSVRQKQMHNIYAIGLFLGSAKYPLVIDIWTEQAANRLKVYKQNTVPQRIFFCQFFNIAPQCFQGCSFESNINLFQQSWPSDGGEHQNMLFVSLVNYQDEGESSLSIKQSFIKSLIKSASLVIVHMDDNNFGQPNQRKAPSVFNNFKFAFEDSIQKIYIIQLAQNRQQSYSQIIRNFDPGYKLENLFFFQKISNVGQQNQYNMSRVQALYELCLKVVKLKFQVGSQTLTNGLGNGICLTKTVEQQIRSAFKDVLTKFLEKMQLSLPEYYRVKRLYDIRMKISTNFQQCLPSIEDEGYIHLQNQMNTFQIMRQQLQEQEKKIKMAINQRKNINISQFILQFIRLIQKDNITFQLSLQILKEESNKRTLFLLEQLKKKYYGQQQHLGFKKQSKPILADYISIDNIIQQFNYFKQTSLNSASDSTDYYQKCLNTSRPFSLIDGVKNSFGNQLLKTFLERSNQISSKKNIFVVSVIGSKESGKSSFLSYLFPRSIYFEQDPFAKGVYMSVHQVNNKTIVVLDVLGIIGVNGTIPNPKYTSQQQRQFAPFEHQCISFLMKQSDLVIFPASISLNEQLIISLNLGIYLTILNAFAVNNSQKDIIPKNVIFAFSGVSERADKTYKSYIIESLIRQISPILRRISMQQPKYNNLRSVFNKYVYLTQQDIFFLPKEQPDIFSFERTKVQEYGLNILALRNRVMMKINEIQELGLSSRTIIDFYQNAKVSWQTILLTTEKIVSTISIGQLDLKLSIHEIYQKNYSEIYSTIPTLIEKKYNFDRIKKRIVIPSNYPLGSIYQIYGLLVDIINLQGGNDMEKIAFSSFQNQCLAITRQFGLINHFSRLNFRRIFNSLSYDHLKYQYFLELENENFNNCLQKYLVQLVQRINRNRIRDQEFIDIIYQQKVKQLFDSFFMNRQGDKAKIFQQKTQLLRDFKIILSSQNIFKNLQIEDIKDCTDFDEKNSLIYANKFIHFENQGQISQEDKASLIEILKKNINSFDNSIKDNIFNNIYQIQHQVNQTINKTIQETNKQIQSRAKQIYSRIDSKKENLEIQEAIAKKIVNVIQNLKKNDDDSYNLEIMKQYYEKLYYRINNKSTERRKIHLNRINLKAVLLGKLFKRLYNSIDENYRNEIEMKKKLFQRKTEDAKVHIII